MSGVFLTNPGLKKIKEATSLNRAKWELLDPLRYETSTGRRFNVPVGFQTDFASVPRIPFAYWFTGDTAHLSAVLHDYLCVFYVPVTDGMTWVEAADIFKEAMIAEGVPAWRRTMMYWAVRLFGDSR